MQLFLSVEASGDQVLLCSTILDLHEFSISQIIQEI